MLKSHQLVDYEFPYAILASRFINYFNIDVDNEIEKFTKASNEITERHLKNLGMTYVDHEQIIARKPPTEANENQMEEEAKGEAQRNPAHQWNPFESLMIHKLNVILHQHQEHQAEVHSSLENITTRSGNIETRLSLSNLLNPDEDEA